MNPVREFSDTSAEPAVRGFLHEPTQPSGDALVLTHGAGANCQSKLLTAVANAFADAGYLVLRCDLPFRQSRPSGPPFPAMAARDREGLSRAVEIMRCMATEKMAAEKKTAGKIFLGGHSYGGRQSTMLAAEQPQLVSGLLLLSYPLHPPRKPADLRTAHFPKLNTPALFIHGSRDPFGSHAEMKDALALIPARNLLMEVEGGGHDLLGKKANDDLPMKIVAAFQTFFK
jgi:predicted alpha/beta-hydrolase family hydrolase